MIKKYFQKCTRFHNEHLHSMLQFFLQVPFSRATRDVYYNATTRAGTCKHYKTNYKNF